MDNSEKQTRMEEIIALIEKRINMLEKLVATERNAQPFWKSKTFGIILTALVALLGYGATWNLGRQDLKEKELQKQKTYAVSIIQKDIDSQKKESEIIKELVLNLRKVNIDLKNKCNDPGWEPKKAKTKRFDSVYKLAKMNTGSYITFNELIYKKILAFLQFDQNVDNICSSPPDSEWQKLQSDIFKAIKSLIRTEKRMIIDIIGADDIDIVNNKLILFYKLRN